MSERVECMVSGNGNVPQRVLAAMRAAGLIVVEGEGSMLVSGERSVDVMVTLPGETAKRQTANRSACLGDLPLGTAAEERRRAQNAEAHVAIALDRAKGAEERAELAEKAERLLEVSIGRAHKWRERAEKAEAALAAQAKQPSAGDRVRGLTIDVLTSVATGGNYSVRAVADLLPLIAAELDKQAAVAKRRVDGCIVHTSECGCVEVHRAKPARESVAKPADSPTCSGPVTLVSDGERERYGTVSDVGLEHVAVEWLGKLSLFARTDGRCVESFTGIMRGWRIHPDELPRFQPQPAKPPVGERAVVAPDGVELKVRHNGQRRHEPESWTVSWWKGMTIYDRRTRPRPHRRRGPRGLRGVEGGAEGKRLKARRPGGLSSEASLGDQRRRIERRRSRE